MGMAWELVADRPIYAQLVERIQREIVSGKYQPGEKLPSVRDLAAVAAAQAGLLLPLAHVGGGQIPGRRQQVAAAGKDHGVTQPSLMGGAPHRTKPCAVFRRELGHVVTSFAYYFNVVVYHRNNGTGKIDFALLPETGIKVAISLQIRYDVGKIFPFPKVRHCEPVLRLA